jgi:hypothetical protein
VDATAVLELESYIDKDSNMVKAAPAQNIEDQLAHGLAVIEAEEERRLVEEYDEDIMVLTTDCNTTIGMVGYVTKKLHVFYCELGHNLQTY